MTILEDKFADAATLDLKISLEFLIDNAELPTSFLLNANAQYSVSIKPPPIAHAMLEIKDSNTASQLLDRTTPTAHASRLSLETGPSSLAHAAPQETLY